MMCCIAIFCNTAFPCTHNVIGGLSQFKGMLNGREVVCFLMSLWLKSLLLDGEKVCAEPLVN